MTVTQIASSRAATGAASETARAPFPRPTPAERPRAPTDRLGLLERLLHVRRRLGISALTVLAYHRIGEPDPRSELDGDVVDASPSQFRAQLEVLRTCAVVIGAEDLRRLLARGGRIPRGAVMITFDDGYRDNVEVALPELLRAGLPATFFVATAYPDAGRLYWWDRIALLVRRSRRAVAHVDHPHPLMLAPARDPRGTFRRLVTALKRTPGADPARLGPELEQALEVHLDREEERRLAARVIMGWDDVRTLRRAGMSVQSHAHEHRILATLSRDALRADLAASTERLRAELGETPFALAYPAGHPPDARARGVLAESGFELGLTYGTGACLRLAALDPFLVPRVAMRPLSAARFRALLALPFAR